jgi:penicillin V acylase-like amidase (Ntn superfamily)
MKNTLALGLSLLGLCAAPQAAYACSTVFFDKNDQALIGHKMDWLADRLVLVVNKRHVKKHGFVFANDPEFTWISKYGSISLDMEGREITGRGMNEAGLVILEMALGDTQQSSDSKVPRLSVGQWAQYQLDTSATIAEVIASDNVVRQSPEEEWQSQFMLWDRTGAVVLMEWLEGRRSQRALQEDVRQVPRVRRRQGQRRVRVRLFRHAGRRQHAHAAHAHPVAVHHRPARPAPVVHQR